MFLPDSEAAHFDYRPDYDAPALHRFLDSAGAASLCLKPRYFQQAAVSNDQ
jgi:hypothetical protein